jgi:hypothetical protein
MIYAIISDIHANLEALQAVLADIKKRKIHRKICLGDIVGYCAAPNECIELVRDFDIILMGNHDYAVKDAALVEKFNFHARLAIEWTIANLSIEEKEYIVKLKYSHRENGITFVHATPRNPEGWGYIMNIDDAMDAFNYIDTDLCSGRLLLTRKSNSTPRPVMSSISAAWDNREMETTGPAMSFMTPMPKPWNISG